MRMLVCRTLPVLGHAPPRERVAAPLPPPPPPCSSARPRVRSGYYPTSPTSPRSEFVDMGTEFQMMEDDANLVQTPDAASKNGGLSGRRSPHNHVRRRFGEEAPGTW